jgi:hypothetical protein
MSSIKAVKAGTTQRRDLFERLSEDGEAEGTPANCLCPMYGLFMLFLTGSSSAPKNEMIEGLNSPTRVKHTDPEGQATTIQAPKVFH